MHVRRTILSLSTVVIALAGVSAFSAEPAVTSCAAPAAPAPTNGDCRLGADATLEDVTAIGPELALQTEGVAEALDDSCVAACDDPTVEAFTPVACSQAVKDGLSPAPERQIRCGDLFDGDCFAGCCASRGRLRKWRECCQAVGGPCNPDCEAVCTPRWCTTGPAD